MRELAFEQGLLVSEVKKEFEGQKTKFENYTFKEGEYSPSHQSPSHVKRRTRKSPQTLS